MSDPAGTAGAVQYYVNSSTFGGDKDKLFLDTSNVRLGIGLDSPVGTVHLASDYGSTETGGLYIQNQGTATADDVSPIAFTTRSSDWGTVHAATIAAGTHDSTSGGAYLVLKTSSTGQYAPTERLRITSTGEVGIGTSSPSSGFKLDVDGKAIIRDDLNLYNDYCIQYWKKANGTDNLGWILNRDDNSCQYMWSSGQPLMFGTTTTGGSTSEKLRLLNSGMVGINETAPDTTNSNILEVKSSANSTTSAIRITNKDTSAGTDQGAALDFGLSRNSGAFKPQAGKIAVRRALDWTADDANIDAFMTFSVYENNALSEKMRINANGYVGIGTAGSYNGLHIKPASGNGQLVVEKASGASYSVNSQTSLVQIGTISNHPLQLMTNSNAYAHLTTGGNFGIGTTSPDVKLHLYDSTINSLDLLHLETAADSVDDYIGIKFTSGVGGSGPHAAIRVYGGPASGDSYMSLLTTSDGGTLTQGLTQIHNGWVGIGTTSPVRVLELSADTNSTVDLFRLTNADTTYAQTVDFSLDTNKDLVIAGSSGNGGLHFNMGSRGYTFSNGNVGIGMTPGSTYGLYVSGKPVKFISDGSASNGAVLELVHANSNSNDVVSSLSFANNVGGVARIEGGTSGGNTNGYISFFTDNVGTSTEKMRIDANGLVGIGSSSPSSYYSNANDLVVARNDHAGITIKTGTAHTGWLVFADGTASGDNTRGGISYDHNNDLMAFRVNNDRKVSIDSNGIVTIGGNASAADMNITSTGSTSNLTVQAGEANIATIKLNSDDGDDASDITILEQSNGGPFKIKTNNGGSTAISCDSGGNVAINQATASYALDVNGVVNCTSLRFADGTSISTTPTGTVLLRDLNPAAFNYDMHVAGKVGIGTTSPDHSLEIDGGSGTDLLHLNSDAPIVKVTATNNSSGLRINTVGQSSGQLLRVQKDGTTRFQIDHDGHVGIGTASPSTNLEIYQENSGGGTTSKTLLNLRQHATGDLSQQKSFIEFNFTDANNNGTPQVKIGAEVGENADANSERKEGSGAFVVYTATGTTTTANSLTEKMRVSYDGKVGIGTTVPRTDLEIEGNSSDSGLRINSSSSYSDYGSALCIGHDSAGHSYFHSYDFQFRTGPNSARNNLALFLSHQGKIGSGTGTPLGRLHLRAAANLGTNFQAAKNGDTAIRFDITNFHSNIVVPMIEAASDNSNTLPPAVRIASQFTSYGSNLIFGTSNSYANGVNNSALTIKWDARIGLNQQAPAATLDVWKSPRHSTNDIRLRRADNQSTYAEWNYNSGTCNFGTQGSDHLAFKTNGAARMTLHASNGNVGIATTNPAYRLDVDGTVRCSTLIFKDGTSFSSVGAVGNKAIAVNVGGGSSNPEGRAKSVVDASYGGIQNGLVLVYYHYRYSSHCGNGGCTRTAYAKRAYQVVDGNWSYIFGF